MSCLSLGGRQAGVFRMMGVWVWESCTEQEGLPESCCPQNMKNRTVVVGHWLAFFAYTPSIGSESGAAGGYRGKRQQPFKVRYRSSCLWGHFCRFHLLCAGGGRGEEGLSMYWAVPETGKSKKESTCELATLRMRCHCDISLNICSWLSLRAWSTYSPETGGKHAHCASAWLINMLLCFAFILTIDTIVSVHVHCC